LDSNLVRVLSTCTSHRTDTTNKVGAASLERITTYRPRSPREGQNEKTTNRLVSKFLHKKIFSARYLKNMTGGVSNK
jgi:hypothetical protein